MLRRVSQGLEAVDTGLLGCALEVLRGYADTMARVLEAGDQRRDSLELEWRAAEGSKKRRERLAKRLLAQLDAEMVPATLFREGKVGAQTGGRARKRSSTRQQR